MFRSTSEFDKQLEKATSHLLLEPDWQSIIQICDIICQGDCQPKYAISAIKKRFYNQNPYVALYALQVMESVVKNCGSPIHDEVASKAFMDELREMVHKTTNDKVRSKVLELVQTWAYAFRNTPKYSILPDTLNILKAEGYTFPTLRESDAMFAADRAPNWTDGDNCHRCRVQFSVIVRKHHCRACGQVFCGKCTPRSCTLPKFGIEKEVRVCEDCFEKHNSDGSTGGQTGKSAESDGPAGDSKSLDKSRKEEELKLQEEEELQLALALSRSEAEHKTKDSGRSSSHSPMRTYTSPIKESAPSAKVTANEIEDPELARYLNRSYWEEKKLQELKDLATSSMTKSNSGSDLYAAPSAPATTVSNVVLSPGKTTVEKYHQNGGGGDQQQQPDEVDDFCSSLSSQLDIFVNRMKSNSSRGRPIANDSSVQTLFLNITAMHTKLMQYIQQQENARVYYEGLQDKLTQAKDARSALDALREEHRERLRREAEEAERLRQIQMAQKLEIMRKKKQEYLQYQRQLAMQRMQEEEREMQLRMEQQKQMYQLRGGVPPMQMPNMGGYPHPHGPYMGPPQQPAYHPLPHNPHEAMYMQQQQQHQLPPQQPQMPPQQQQPQPYQQPGPYGPMAAYPPQQQPQQQQQPYPQPGMVYQQPASAPAAGHYAPAPLQMQMPMMGAPQQQQQHQPQHLPQAPQPAVAELISFD